MDPLLQFSQIKILKNKVEITPCPIGVKIHFKIDNQKWFNSTLNGHLPTIFECSGDLDELDEEEKKVYMDESLKSKVQAICEATIDYLKICPKPEQLSLFALPEMENA